MTTTPLIYFENGSSFTGYCTLKVENRPEMQKMLTKISQTNNHERLKPQTTAPSISDKAALSSKKKKSKKSIFA